MPSIQPAAGEHRTPEQLTEHYCIEKELAGRLRAASREQRRGLYSVLYDELYRRVPLHPQLVRKASPGQTKQTVDAQLALLGRFLTGNTTFLEIGPGSCALSFEVARRVRKVYAVDVSDEITRSLTKPTNFSLILSDGTSIPLPPCSVDVAYSNQLMEHLHPDDAFEQLANIYNALAPGGVYVCITPGRLSGPHDISKYFDRVATGFHLKEYTVGEVTGLFGRVGFSRVKTCIGARGRYVLVSPRPLIISEMLLGLLPYALRRMLARRPPFSRLMRNVEIVGTR